MRPASLRIVRRLSLLGSDCVLSIVIECDAGGAPRMGLVPDRRDRMLDCAQWSALIEEIRDEWVNLSIRCNCGCAFGRHTAQSPHRCTSHQECEQFSAAEPLREPST